MRYSLLGAIDVKSFLKFTVIWILKRGKFSLYRSLTDHWKLKKKTKVFHSFAWKYPLYIYSIIVIQLLTKNKQNCYSNCLFLSVLLYCPQSNLYTQKITPIQCVKWPSIADWFRRRKSHGNRPNWFPTPWHHQDL